MSNNPEKEPAGELDEDAEEGEDEEANTQGALPHQHVSTADVDLNALAEKVYQRIRHEVLIERERRTGRISS